MERNIKLTLQYDGTNYHGFQRQANALAIQQVVEERLAALFGHPVRLNASGRTDAGVHAYGQVVNFYTTSSIPVNRIVPAANSVLPVDIVAVHAEEREPWFHARKSALRKTYLYRIYNAPLPSPFERNYAWHLAGVLDAVLINEVARQIIGTHDFSAFRAAGSAPVDPVKTIYEASCWQQENIVLFRFTGSGFLYHMVRNLVGTLAEIGMGRRAPEDFAAILASRDRKQAGVTAPPQGLYLMQVDY